MIGSDTLSAGHVPCGHLGDVVADGQIDQSEYHEGNCHDADQDQRLSQELHDVPPVLLLVAGHDVVGTAGVQLRVHRLLGHLPDRRDDEEVDHGQDGQSQGDAGHAVEAAGQSAHGDA
ncbi:hypothetical protein KDA23_07400, partial [Candidatus Saccharibacteria bacterium]|nr:hypothetical protein [Candidatus Saccharibacteria bacterium]